MTNVAPIRSEEEAKEKDAASSSIVADRGDDVNWNRLEKLTAALEPLSALLAASDDPKQKTPTPRVQWIGIIVIALSVLINPIMEYLAPDQTPIIERLDEIQKNQAETDAKWEARFTGLDDRLESMEKALKSQQKTDAELSSAISDYVEMAGYEQGTLPPSVRLVILRNEQKKLEKEAN